MRADPAAQAWSLVRIGELVRRAEQLQLELIETRRVDPRMSTYAWLADALGAPWPEILAEVK